MSEEKKETEQTAECGCSRRKFTQAGAAAIGVAATGSAVFGYEFLSPNVLYEPSPIVDAGKPDRFAPDSVTADTANAIYIVRGPEGIYTLSAVCTHLGCITAWKPELGIIACPCHGSKFHTNGEKIEGPAPRPLPWLRTWVDDDGNLQIDRSDQLARKQFVRI